MKMIIAILRDTDGEPVAKGLTSAGFRVTEIASTGGFLRRGSTTFLIGLEDDQVEPALSLIRKKVQSTGQNSVEAGQKRATIFVLPIDHSTHF
jgi:uncharacterized protein YaaQ